MNIIKLLTLVSLFKDVTAEVQAAGKEKRPWYLQRTVWGAIMAVISTAAASFLGLTLDQATLDHLTDNIPQLITVATGLWGTALSVYGAFKKMKAS